MKRLSIIYMLLFLFLTISCEKEQERMDDFLLEFATVVKPNDKISFMLDNYRTLIPISNFNYKVEKGQRVLINYTPLNGDTIKVNSLSEIYTDDIKESTEIELLSYDEVKVQSVWVGGGYLNVILEVEYYEKNHSISLVRDMNSSDIDLFLSYSKNGDSPGYPKKVYASFSLANIKSVDGAVPFALYINIFTGFRKFNLKVE